MYACLRLVKFLYKGIIKESNEAKQPPTTLFSFKHIINFKDTINFSFMHATKTYFRIRHPNEIHI